jgi:hypothetical protein
MESKYYQGNEPMNECVPILQICKQDKQRRTQTQDHRKGAQRDNRQKHSICQMYFICIQ